MRVLKLKINDAVYENFMWFLNKFSTQEIEILQDEILYNRNKTYLENELKEIKEGKAEFITDAEAEKKLDMILSKYEKDII